MGTVVFNLRILIQPFLLPLEMIKNGYFLDYKNQNKVRLDKSTNNCFKLKT